MQCYVAVYWSMPPVRRAGIAKLAISSGASPGSTIPQHYVQTYVTLYGPLSPTLYLILKKLGTIYNCNTYTIVRQS